MSPTSYFVIKRVVLSVATLDMRILVINIAY